LAGQVALNWNPLICSLTLLCEKLDNLGFSYCNGEVTYSGNEDNKNA